jgi:hypothetical protein
MRGRKMPAAASRRSNGRTASCRTLPLIVGVPQSVGPTLLQRGMTAVGWHPLADDTRSFDPTSLGGRSSTPRCVNRRRGTMGQENSGHGVMFITRAAAHESRWVLDSPGSPSQNTDAPPGFLCRRRCDTNNPALLPLVRTPLPQRESTTAGRSSRAPTWHLRRPSKHRQPSEHRTVGEGLRHGAHPGVAEPHACA